MLSFSNVKIKVDAIKYDKNLPQISLELLSALEQNQILRTKKLIGLNEYLQKFQIKRKIVLESKRSGCIPFSVTPSIIKDKVSENYRQHPDVYFTCIDNVVVRNNSSLLYTDDYVIASDLFDSVNDLLAEEEVYKEFQVLDMGNNDLRISYVEDSMSDLVIDEAILLTDAASHNHAHWLTEVLPKIYAINALPELYNIPIIINNNLHANTLQTMALASNRDISCYVLMPDTAARVKKIHVISSVGYVQYENRVFKKKLPPSEYLHNWSGAFSQMLNHHKNLYSRIPSEILLNLKEKYREYTKIYIRRSSSVRVLMNSAEIEADLLCKGFKVVEPEKLNFIEQVYIFRNAKVIVGPSGAGFGNIVFCSPGAKIHIFCCILYQITYWSNISKAVGNLLRINYIVGEKVDTKLAANIHEHHTDYIINRSLLSVIV